MRKNKKMFLNRGFYAERLTDGVEHYEGVNVNFDKIYQKKVRKITSLYFLTAILLIISLFILIFITKGIKLNNELFERGIQKAVLFFTENDFLSISISNNKDDGETNTNNKDTDKNNDIINNAGNGEDNSDSSEYNDGSPVLKPLTKDELYFFDKELVPKGETAIIPMDVSLSSYGSGYINNSTGYTPDTAKLLAKQLKDTVDIEYLVSSNSPIVLILHTHATEAYSEDGDISYYDDGGEYARSKNTNENVVAVGRVLAEELNKQGIYTLHSETLHDAEQYKDSYARSEETIRAYLEKYPTIRFVIDLHRDAIVKSDGSIVRPVTLSEGEAAAQVMCVVGSDWGGDKCDGWENNLSLALKLREELNSVTENLCRPTYLRSSTYNQELAPYSLLLEIGSSGNSIEEAKKSAVLVAKALTKLIKEI